MFELITYVMTKKLCMIFDTPSLYREAIHEKIDENFDCDWYFGDYDYKVKTYNPQKYEHIEILHVVDFPHIGLYATKGMVELLFKKQYKNFFMVGEPRNISVWVLAIFKRLFFRKKKLYFWAHGWYGKESFVQGFIKKLVYKSANGIFSYGSYAKELMVKNGFDNNKIFVIHNSLNFDKQLEIRKSLNVSSIYKEYFGNDDPTLIFIGRLTAVKRLDMLIDAVAKLNRKSIKVNLVLVGDGVMRRGLEGQVTKLNIEKNVWFYGACYDEKENAELIYNADLCVAPGNVGLTAIHAMMFGTPVISHDKFMYQMPEFEAIKIGITGDYFKCESVDSLCSVISKWLKLHMNDRQRIRENCFREIDKEWNPYYQINVIKNNLILN